MFQVHYPGGLPWFPGLGYWSHMPLLWPIAVNYALCFLMGLLYHENIKSLRVGWLLVGAYWIYLKWINDWLNVGVCYLLINKTGQCIVLVTEWEREGERKGDRLSDWFWMGGGINWVWSEGKEPPTSWQKVRGQDKRQAAEVEKQDERAGDSLNHKSFAPRNGFP